MIRQYIFHGTVQHGKKRGKLLGFPTLNVSLSQHIPEGIYLSQITIRQEVYHALTFIGTAKTYKEITYQSETYVFDFDKDIYGEVVAITLLKKIRDNKAFDSEEALITQMEADKKQAELYFFPL